MSDKFKEESRSRLARRSSIRFWVSRHFIPASYWQREFRAIRNLHGNDWSARLTELDSAVTWAAYRVTIIFLSITGFLFGIGQLMMKVMGG